MAIEFAKEMDVGQGYNFKQDTHHSFGYITQWLVGDNNISPDIKVVDPGSLGTVAQNVGTTGGGEMNTAGILKFPVVAVLSNASWSTRPTDNITLQGRISLPNTQTLQMLIMQSMPKVVMRIGFVVYQYDDVNQVYYTSFKTYQGAAVSGPVKPTNSGGNGGFANADASTIFALLGKTSGTEFGLKVGTKVQEDIHGIRNYTLELTLSPPISGSPQQILVQTSSTIKLIQPWGLPQK